MQIDNIRASDMQRVALLHEYYSAQVFAPPVVGQAQRGYQLAAVGSLGIDATDDTEAADHRGMTQSAAAVFSSFYGSFRMNLYQCNFKNVFI